MSVLSDIWWFVRHFGALCRVLWKAQNGRLYYFRDESREFVEVWSECPYEEEPYVRMRQEACDELARRVRRDAVRQREFYDQVQFRVWPDGTVQALGDGEPYSHMSDDFVVVWAYDEDEAQRKAFFGA